MSSALDLEQVRAGLALAQAEFALAGLRRQLRCERWVSLIVAVGAIVVLAVLPCGG